MDILFLYLKAGYSTAAALYAFAGKLLMFFSFCDFFLTLIVNIRGTGTFALIYFLILVFVTPVGTAKFEIGVHKQFMGARYCRIYILCTYTPVEAGGILFDKS